MSFVSDSMAHLFADTAATGVCVNRRQPYWRLVFALVSGIEISPGNGGPVRGVLIPPDFPSTRFLSRGHVNLYLEAWDVAPDVPVRVTVLDDRACRNVLGALRLDETADLATGREAIRKLLGASSRLDPRVSYVLHNLTRHGRLGELAVDVGLSPPRLRALVQATVGIPLVRLRHFARLKAAYAALDQGLAVAAGEGGFVDQSHFTRVSRSLLGFPPGSLLKAPPHRIAPLDGGAR